ncbi:MAG: phospho-sugar mutase [Puniceicoccaceae bacterium]
MKALELIGEGAEKALLLPAAAAALHRWWEGTFLPDWGREAILELLEGGSWEELNDRFYQEIQFGTGGMRGRTIGRVQAAAEREGPGNDLRPLRAGIGTNMINDFSILRATAGLYQYARAHLDAQGRGWERPSIVIAHDVRFFSRHFCELVASAWTRLGGEAFIFQGARSTPQLSFTVRHLKATTGVVITASHNPPHDNGFKAYFEDGAQAVSPHAEGIVAAVGAVDWDELPALMEKDLSRVVTLDRGVDDAYENVVLENVVDLALIKRVKPRVVFSPIHGTGAVAGVPAMRRAGIEVLAVESQMVEDPLFSTVKSPNPENAEALQHALDFARETGSGVVIATDPDGDRMGVAVADEAGEMKLLTGNMIGSVLAEFRIQSLKEAGILTDANKERATLIKTFVTTPLQEQIAKQNGIRCVNTLTGFKWIGEKLRIYEETLLKTFEGQTGAVIDYDRTAFRNRMRLQLEAGTFYVFGGEESYGYLASDAVRDKDANAAALIFCELVARLEEEGKTVIGYLDDIYRKYGYFRESLVNVYYEGAVGAAKIASILKSYRESPPAEMGGVEVVKFTDFGREEIEDADGKMVPKQDFYTLELQNGFSYAVRGSGTEPKIKFYTFGQASVGAGADLEQIKAAVELELDKLGKAIAADAAARAGD